MKPSPPKIKISGIENMTPAQLFAEVQNGGRFVIFQHCYSFVIMTIMGNSGIRFLKAGENRLALALPDTLLTLAFGWWGIPWGPIRSIQVIASNLGGGKDVTPQAMAALHMPMLPELFRSVPGRAAAGKPAASGEPGAAPASSARPPLLVILGLIFAALFCVGTVGLLGLALVASALRGGEVTPTLPPPAATATPAAAAPLAPAQATGRAVAGLPPQAPLRARPGEGTIDLSSIAGRPASWPPEG